MFESDEGYEALDAILGVEGIDMVGVGRQDWAVGLGLYGDRAESDLGPKIETVYGSASRARKTISVSVSSPDEASHYVDLGARVFFLGVDVTIKRRALAETIAPFKD